MPQQQFTSNQFNNNIPVKGDTALVKGFNVLPVMLDPDSVATLYPGDAVVMTTQTGVAIFVEKAAATDNPFGFVLYDMKKSTYTAGDAFEIACFGTAIYAQAQGTISRGDNLEYVPDLSAPTDDPLMKVNAGVNPISAFAIDNASNGDIFRMIVLGTASYQGTLVITGGSINNTPIGQGTANLGKFTVLEATTSLTVSGATITTILEDAISALSTGATISLDPTLGGLFTLTPVQSCTINAATVPSKHQRIVVEVVTSGTTAYTITFGTHFKTSGTLSSGSVTAKTFLVVFDGDGTNFVEASRTTAL